MIIRLNDNPKILVYPDYQGYTVTGNTYYTFIGSGATVVTQVQTGNLITDTIYSPIIDTSTFLDKTIFDTYTGDTDTRLLNAEADINYLSGQTQNKLDTLIYSNYTGVTAPLQFAAKAHLHTGVYSPTGHTHSYIGATITNKPSFVGSGGTIVTLVNNVYKISSAVPTGTTVEFLDILGNATDNISLQAALNTKSNTGHTHTESQVLNLVQDLQNRSLTGHTHTGVYSPTGHTHVIANITGLQTALNDKSSTGHTHTTLTGLTIGESQVTNLVGDLAGKSSTGHTHTGVYLPATGLTGYWNSGQTVSYVTGVTPTVTWTGMTGKPQWLTATTLASFETGHTHSLSNLDDVVITLPTATSYLRWTTGGGGQWIDAQVQWGEIAGIIGLQTDLMSLINSKTPTGTTAQLRQDFNSHSGQTDIHFLMSAITGFSQTNHSHSYTGASITDKPDLSQYQPITGMSLYQPVSGMSIYLTGFTVTCDMVTGCTDSLYLHNDALNGYWNSGQTEGYISGLGYLTGITWGQVSGKPNLALQSDFISHSGDSTIHFTQGSIAIAEGQVTNLVTDLATISQDIADLGQIQTVARLYADNHASDIGGYGELLLEPLTITGVTAVINLNNNELLFKAFVTPANLLNVVDIPAGVWHFRAYAQWGAATGVNYLHFDTYILHSGGSESFVQRISSADISVTTLQEYQLEFVLPIVTMLPSDRVVLKVLGSTTGGAKSCTLYFGGSSQFCFVQPPVPIVASPYWVNIQDKPQWLSGVTLSQFEAGHVHSQYLTGQTAPSWSSITSKPAYLGNISGTTSDVQQQLNGKSSTGHTHAQYLTGVTWNTVTSKPSWVGSGATVVNLVGSDYRIYSPVHVADTWAQVTNKPSWLSGTTQQTFQAQHTHEYISGLTSAAQTQINTKLATTIYQTYTGTTAPNTYAPKAQPVLAGMVDITGVGNTGTTNNFLRIRNTENKSWVINEEVGRIGFYTEDPSGIGAHEGARIQIINTLTQTTPAFSMVFSTGTNATPTEKLRITHDGVVSIAGLTASRALVTGVGGILAVATTTATEIGYLNGVTSAIQTQFTGKASLAGATFTGQILTTAPGGGAGITRIGDHALNANTGNYNTAFGDYALSVITSGAQNAAFGNRALLNLVSTASDNNTALGNLAGRYRGSGTDTLTGATNSTLIGYATRASANDNTNETVIGYNTVGNGSNTVTIGNTSVVGTYVRGLNTTGAINNLNTDSNFATNINAGTSTGTITLGGTGIQSIAIGNNTGVKNINIGNHATPANLITIGGAASTTTLNGTVNVTNATDILSLVPDLGYLQRSGTTIVGSTPIDLFTYVTDGKLLARNGNNVTGITNNFSTITQTIVSATGTTTIDASHSGKIIECNGTFTVTFPNSMATGMIVDIVNIGTGTITIAAATTLQSSGTKLASQYVGASVYHRGSNVWLAVGRLTT